MLNIFFPIRLNNNFIFKKNIIIIYITQYNFSAILVNANGNKRRIIKNIYFEFDNKENFNNDIFISSLISKSILNWEYDYIKLILASNITIFRSLHSPFSDIEKIKMTIPFELESMLPFQLSEASVDVIYQNKVTNNEKNKILAVITKEEYLNFYREIFKKLNLSLYAISIDAIEIIQYDLYYFKDAASPHIVIYNNESGLLILLFSNNALVAIKYIDIIIKNTIENYDSKELSEENSKKIDTDFYCINQTIDLLGKDFNFSLSGINIYLININANEAIIKKIIQQYNFILNNYIVDDKNEYIGNQVIISKNNDESIHIKNDFIYIACSLFTENDIFNLGHKEDTDFKNKILFKQTIVAIITSLTLYIIILIYNFLDLYKINTQIKQSELKILNVLKNEFKLSNKYLGSLDTAFIEAKKIVDDLENNLPILATHNKFLFITAFSELVRNLSHEIKGLQIYEMRWKLGIETPTIISLTGEVLDFDSLHLLEESLKKSNLFVMVPKQQDLHFNFNLTII